MARRKRRRVLCRRCSKPFSTMSDNRRQCYKCQPSSVFVEPIIKMHHPDGPMFKCKRIEFPGLDIRYSC